jgi:hypothetical protein
MVTIMNVYWFSKYISMMKYIQFDKYFLTLLSKIIINSFGKKITSLYF